MLLAMLMMGLAMVIANMMGAWTQWAL